MHLSFIVIGGWSNTHSSIRQGKGKNFPDFFEPRTTNILNSGEFREFRISWAGGKISVFKAGEKTPFMTYTHSTPFPVKYVGYTTGWGSSGQFVFCGVGKIWWGGGILVFQGGNHPHKAKHVIRFAFQVMYAWISYRVKNLKNWNKKACFLAMVINFGKRSAFF